MSQFSASSELALASPSGNSLLCSLTAADELKLEASPAGHTLWSRKAGQIRTHTPTIQRATFDIQSELQWNHSHEL